MDMDKKIILLSSEGDLFEVDAAVAMESQTIKNMIEDNFGYGGIPITKFSSKILAKVIEYCEKQSMSTTSKNSFVGMKNSLRSKSPPYYILSWLQTTCTYRGCWI